MLQGLGRSNPSVMYEMFNDSLQIRGRERDEIIQLVLREWDLVVDIF
jgi:hypothetical protein